MELVIALTVFTLVRISHGTRAIADGNETPFFIQTEIIVIQEKEIVA